MCFQCYGYFLSIRHCTSLKEYPPKKKYLCVWLSLQRIKQYHLFIYLFLSFFVCLFIYLFILFARCPSQYLGPQCLQSNSIGLTNMELGLIIALPLALLLFTLVGVATCLMMRRRSAVDAPVEYYDDGPSMA